MDDGAATTPNQVSIDSDIKLVANALFARLCLDMSSAANPFLYQRVLCGGLLFTVEMPQYSEPTLSAMAEARRISRVPDVQEYISMDDLKAALDD